MTLDEILASDVNFRYSLLARMKQDCEYYLGNGGRNANCLWAFDEQSQIDSMRAIYESFLYGEEPAFITAEDIDDYEERMLHPPVCRGTFVFKNAGNRMESFTVENVFDFVPNGSYIKGYVEADGYLRKEMIGLPRFSGWLGPMWDGGAVRYETQEAYDDLSC